MTKSEALEASILHWQENVAAEWPEDVRMGQASCALCSLFFDQCCEGCPVMRRTGYSNSRCSGTPYIGASYALFVWRETRSDAARDDFRKRAQVEVDFLISLRESGE